MIYITGDTHIPTDIHKLSARSFYRQKAMSAADYVIICGDFGGIWDNSHEEQYWLKWLDTKNFTTLFIDGNHENHERLDRDFPIVPFCGAYAHKIRNKIVHLLRGQVYSLNQKKFFTMGGASSHDRSFRRAGVNWWEEELPSQVEYQKAMENLAACNWQVDYILTHCTSDSLQAQLAEDYEVNELTHFLEFIKNNVSYQGWFFGHYHQDIQLDSKHRCVFNDLVPLG